MAYPRFRLARAHRSTRRTSGILTLNSTAWANVDTGLDIILEAQVGDELRATLGTMWESATPIGYLDVVTLVSAAPLNSFAKRGAVEASPTTVTGVPAWIGPASTQTPVSGAAPLYTVVSGDIVSGAVTLRLRYATSTATNRSLNASTAIPLDFTVENLGPADPE